jgi:EpsI family protein
MKSRTLIFTSTLVLLGATLALSKVAERRRPHHLARPLAAIPKTLDGWTAEREDTLTEGVLSKLKPTEYLSRMYQKGGNTLGLFIAYYAEQRAGESMHSPKHCLPGAGWEIWNYGTADIPFGSGRATINTYSIQNAGTRALVLYWYQSRERITASEYAGKLLLIRDTLLSGETAGSIVRITLADKEDQLPGALNFAGRIATELNTLISAP